MSDGNDFEAFLATARAEHTSEATADRAERVGAALGSRVSWDRQLSEEAAASLETMSDASKRPASGWRWTKTLAFGLPILGLTLASYSLMTPSTAPPSTGARVERAASPVMQASPEPSAASPVEATQEPPLPSLPSSPSSPFSASEPVVVGANRLPDALPDAKAEKAEKADKRTRPGAASSRSASDGTLEAELALLREVTAALQTKQAGKALALVEEHDRRFPSGLLAPEFAGQRAITLAALGRHAEACAQSGAFLAKYPKSPLAAQVRASCDPR